MEVCMTNATAPSMRRHRGALVLAAAAALSLAAGCDTMSPRERGTAKGAGIGAATGAAVGAVTGGSDRAVKGAVVGGAIGAVAGNLWSKRMEDKRVQMERATQGTGIDVARTQDNQLKVNVPSDFSFDVGSAAIKPQMRPVLDQFAQGLDPRMRVTVVGHTDDTGGEAINDRLSLERAASVREYLRTRGIDEGRVIANGRGEHEPVASNDSSTGRAQNRRVEMFLSEPEARG
jgi:outer membrane protein OmpA-like peptidoglycan-associated protein